MSEETKSVAQELKEMLDSAVAAKADSAQLEEKADKAELEGVVKSEQLDEVKSAVAELVAAAKAEMAEEMEAKFAAVPAMETKAEPEVNGFKKIVTETGEEVSRKTLILSKAVPDGSAEATIPGSRVGVNPLYQEMEIANPFRPYVTIMPVSTSSFKLPDFNGASFVSDNVRQTIDGTAENNDDNLNMVRRGLRASEARLQSRVINTERWTSTTEIARPTLDDIENLRGFVQSTIVNAYGKAQGFDAKAILEAGVSTAALAPVALATTRTAAQTVFNNLEVATANFTTTGIYEIMDDLIQNTNVAYRPGGRFYMPSSIMSLLQRSTSSATTGFEFDPVARVNRLWGYEIVVNDYLDGNAVGNHPMFFGTMNRAMILAEQQSLVVDEYDQTLPGYNTYYSHGRFKHATWDLAALSAVEVIA